MEDEALPLTEAATSEFGRQQTAKRAAQILRDMEIGFVIPTAKQKLNLLIAFAKRNLVIFDDEEHSLDEVREIMIGHSMLQRLLLVSFTERGDDLVRIISARKATKRERKDYEEGTRS